MRKTASTNSINKSKINATCGMSHALDMIGGRWKPTILWRLTKKTLRYGQLKQSIEDISERMLILQLRELESDGLIYRIVHSQHPPIVEYALTDLGKSLYPVLESITTWGEMHLKMVNGGKSGPAL